MRYEHDTQRSHVGAVLSFAWLYVLHIGFRQPPRVKRQLRLAKMRSAMQRVRQSMYPRVPETLVGLTRILQNPRYRVIAATVDATDSLYAASVTDRNGHHHIIFSSRRMLRFAKQFTLLFSDGTFKTLPAIDELDDASQVSICLY